MYNSQDLMDETTQKLLDPDRVTHAEADAMESLDYDRIDSHVILEQRKLKTGPQYAWINFQQWVVTFLIGFIVALFAVAMDFGTKRIINLKSTWGTMAYESCSGCFWFPYIVFLLSNITLTAAASAMCVWYAPAGGGSGIPEVKCYLNGIKVPEILRLKTLFAKTVGTTFTVSGGLACGNEGPMIHIGSMIAAGISQGKSSTLSCFATPIFNEFRNDHDKRDFVSGGAAAGIAGAFGAPVGGTLFSLEEGSSFWNQGLTWRTFFCAIVASFTLNTFLSGIYPPHLWSPDDTSPSFVINDTTANPTAYKIPHVPFFILIGICGGLLGALFNAINERLMLFRKRFISRSQRLKFLRWVEVIVISVLSTTISMSLTLLVHNCRSPVASLNSGQAETLSSAKWFCAEGERNDMAILFLGSGEMTVKSLFYAESVYAFSNVTLLCFTIAYFFLAVITLGVAAPSGLLVPCLVIGSGYGRLIGQLLAGTPFLQEYPVNIPTFALIGAASFLGGSCRMTISICVILVETTGSVTRGLPIMVTLMVAKWVGDWFGHGIYDIHIALKKIPLLEWNPSPEMNEVTAESIMSNHVIYFYEVDRVNKIFTILKKTTHNGFPIISKKGILQGLILRSQLITLLHVQAFQEDPDPKKIVNVDLNEFTKDYPRYPDIETIKDEVIKNNRLKYVNLIPYMNLTPYLIQKNATVERVFTLFRTMGLRHLPVIDETGKMIGMITRRDLLTTDPNKRKKEKRVPHHVENFDDQFYEYQQRMSDDARDADLTPHTAYGLAHYTINTNSSSSRVLSSYPQTDTNV